MTVPDAWPDLLPYFRRSEQASGHDPAQPAALRGTSGRGRDVPKGPLRSVPGDANLTVEDLRKLL